MKKLASQASTKPIPIDNNVIRQELDSLRMDAMVATQGL